MTTDCEDCRMRSGLDEDDYPWDAAPWQLLDVTFPRTAVALVRVEYGDDLDLVVEYDEDVLEALDAIVEHITARFDPGTAAMVAWCADNLVPFKIDDQRVTTRTALAAAPVAPG